jgi:hypothetical protein
MSITLDTTSIPGQTIVTDSNGGVAIDYSAVANRIATALENANTLLTSISQSLVDIKADTDVMSQSASVVSGLAQGTGIHTIGPYDWVGLISTYQLLVTQANILDTADNASAEQIELAKTAVINFVNKIKELPTTF